MDEQTARKQWVEQWRRAGPLLDAVKRKELQALTDEEAARQCVSLFEFALSSPSYKPRTTSGFVEQQRLFLKLRKPQS
jgi:hypothetical protein